MQRSVSFIYILLSIVLLSLFAYPVMAQEKVKLSTEVVTIDGKKFYLHKVNKGETLYSICKAYNVQSKLVAEENPEVFDGLSIGQEIKIPIIKNQNSSADEIASADAFNYHIVSGKETLYSISKEYGVTIDQIYKYNPDVKNGLKKGETIRIPKVEKENAVPVTAEDNRYIYHTVEKKETLYSLSKKYNVTLEEIYELNPEAKDGLKKDQILRIPKKSSPQPSLDKNYRYHIVQKDETLYSLSKKYDVSIQQIEYDNPQIVGRALKIGEELRFKIPSAAFNDENFQSDSLKITILDHQDTLSVVDTMKAPCDSFKYEFYRKPYNIGLLLPFSYDEKDVFMEEQKLEGDKFDPKPKIFIEFYQGVLLALDSLKSQGINVNLFVFDTRYDSATTMKIVDSENFRKLDLAIGPLNKEMVPIVAERAKRDSIYLVLPFSTETEILQDNPFCFQVKPSKATQIQAAGKYFGNYEQLKVLIAMHGDSKELKYCEAFESEYRNSFSGKFGPERKVGIVTKSVEEDGTSSIGGHISADSINLVILPVSGTDEMPFIVNKITELNKLTKRQNLVLLGNPEWCYHESIELDYLHNLRMHLFTPYYIDFEDDKVKDFIKKYRHYFKAEPLPYKNTCTNCNAKNSTYFSFAGFDIMYFFTNALFQSGPDFRFCLEPSNLLQSPFRFERLNETSGFENKGVYLIRYEKYFDLVKMDPENFTEEQMNIDFRDKDPK